MLCVLQQSRYKLRDFAIVLFVGKIALFCSSRCIVSTVLLTLFARGTLRAHVLLHLFYFLPMC